MKFFRLFVPIILSGIQLFAANPYRVNYLIEVNNYSQITNNVEFSILIDGNVIETYKGIPSNNKPYFKKIIFIKDKPSFLKLDTEETLINLTKINYDKHCTLYPFQFTSTNGLVFDIIIDVDDIRAFIPNIKDPSLTFCEGTKIVLNTPCEFESEYTDIVWQYTNNLNGPWYNFGSNNNREQAFNVLYKGGLLYFRNILNGVTTNATPPITVLKRPPEPKTINVVPPSCQNSNDWQIQLADFEFSDRSNYSFIIDGYLEFTLAKKDTADKKSITFKSSKNEVNFDYTIDQSAYISYDTDYIINVEFIDQTCLNPPIPVFLPAPPPLEITKISHQPISCHGRKDGQIEIDLKNTTTPVSYSLINSSLQVATIGTSIKVPLTIPVKAADTYTLSVSDACQDTLIHTGSVAITEPAPFIPGIFSSNYGPYCNGKPCNIQNYKGKDTVDITLNGGTAPYQITLNGQKWSLKENKSIQISGLTAGWHKFAFSDHLNLIEPDRGCQMVDSILLLQPGPVSLSLVESRPPLCRNGEDGSIQLSASGGIPWSNFNPFQIDIFQDGLHHQSLLLSNTIDFEKSIFGGSFDYHSGHNFKFVVTDKYSSSDSIITYLPFQVDTVALNTVNITPPKCFNGKDGRIFLSAKGGHPFSQGYDFQLSKDQKIIASYFKTNNLEFNNLSPGTYIISIADSLCNPVKVELILPQPAIQVQLSTLSVAPISCFGEADGKMIVKAQSGIPDYSFYLNQVYERSTDGIIEVTNLHQGIHQLLVKDQNGCKDSVQVTIKMPPKISIAFSPDNIDPPSCFDNSDGYIEPSVSGGTGHINSWNFLWSNNQGFTSNEEILQNVKHGIYHLEVKDINNCKSTANLELIPGPKLNVLQVETLPETCKNRGDGRIIDISTTLDHQNLNYVVDDTIQTNNFLSLKLKEGQHHLIANNSDGCVSKPYWFQIKSNNIEATASVTDSIRCHATTAKVRLDARNSIGMASFYLDSLPVEGQNLNLKAAHYEIFAIDATGCVSTQISLDILEPDALVVNSFESKPEYCGLNNGSAEVNVNGGVSPYKFNWFDTQSQQAVDPLKMPASAYELIIEDQNGCQKIHYFNIAEALDPGIELIETKPDYCSLNLGSAELSIQNGFSPYFLLNTDLQISESKFELSDLSAGWNAIEIKDSKNCVFKDSVFISELPEMKVNVLEKKEASCGLNNGYFSIEVNNGFQPYDIISNNSTANDLTWSDVPAGVYQLRIEDHLGCMINEKITISNLNSPQFDITEIIDSYCDLNTGMAKISSDQYLEENQVNFLNYKLEVVGTGSQVSNLGAGDYFVRVSDNNGCFSYRSFAIENKVSPDLAIQIMDIPQCNASDGVLTGNFASQFEPINYEWFFNENQIGNSKHIEDLYGGIYRLSATDGLGCKKSTLLDLESSMRPTVEANILNGDYCNLQNGSIEIKSNTAHPIINYYLDHSFKGHSSLLEGLASGKHSLYLLDSNYCSSDTIIFQIQSENPKTLTFNLVSPTCHGYSDGKILIQNRIDSTAFYRYKLPDSAWQTQNQFSNLKSGSYSLSAIDPKGCLIDTVLHITEPLPMDLVTSNLISPTCWNGNDGSASFIFGGGIKPYQYQLDEDALVNFSSFDGLEAGTFDLKVYDKNGCSALHEFKIEEVLPLENNLESQYLICKGQTAVIRPARHWETALWNFPDQTTLENLYLSTQTPGSYQYSLISPKGCVLEDSLEILISDQLLKANMLVTSHALVGDSVVIIDITKPEPDQSEWDFGSAEVEILSQNNHSTIVNFNQAGEHSIYLTSQLAECIDRAEQKILISELYKDLIEEDLKTGIFKNFVISPNPSHGIYTFEIELRETLPVELEITDIKSGVSIYSKKLNGNHIYHQLIDMQANAPGLYLVQLSCDSQILKRKLLKI